MADEAHARTPVEEMVKLWQAMMSAGIDAMMRSTAIMTPGKAIPAWTTMFREQLERSMQMAVETSRFPGLADLSRLSGEVSSLREQTEALVAGLAALQAAFQAQQGGWKALEAVIRQTAQAQGDAVRLLETWTAQWEERVAAMSHGMDEWRQRWEEILREGMAVGQASQRGLDEITKTMWDLTRRFAGETRSSDEPGVGIR
jgi:uncharacterized protein YhaN